MAFELDAACVVLERTPRTLDAFLRGLPDAWIYSTEGGESWSPFDVVGHLIHGERTDWIPRARTIRTHGRAQPFAPFDRFAQFEASKSHSLADLLDTFAALRAENLATLQSWNLQPADLTLEGRHPELGPVTLGELLATWVVHDLGHIRQIARVMAKQYTADVGAWQAYLPVLQEKVH